MNDFLTSLNPLGWVLLHSLWQGALVAIGLALALHLTRRSRVSIRYVLSCVALLFFVALPLITFVYMTASKPEAVPGIVDTISDSSDVTVTESVHVLPVITDASRERSWTTTVFELLNRYLAWIVLFWGIGVVVLSIRNAYGWAHSVRIRKRGTRQVGPDWMNRLNALRNRMSLNRTVGMYASTLVPVPTVTGWIKPIILMPVSVFSGMKPDQIEMIVAHELAHIKRHDYLVNLFQTLCETVFFYHPALWWISRQIRTTREHCCDDLAVATCGNAVSYVESLVSLAGTRQVVPRWALAATGGSLTDRVKRLLNLDDDGNHRPARWSAGMVLCLTLIGVAFLSPLRIHLFGSDKVEDIEPVLFESTFSIDVPEATAQSEALEALEEIVFGHPERSIQLEALDVIGTVDSGHGLPALVRTAWTHDDESIRNEAVQKLAYSTSEEAISVLEKIVFSNASTTLQLEALDSLRKMDKGKGLPSLMRIAEHHPDADLRNEAVQWMGRIGSASVVPLLKQIALHDADKDVREEAIDALRSLVEKSPSWSETYQLVQLPGIGVYPDAETNVDEVVHQVESTWTLLEYSSSDKHSDYNNKLQVLIDDLQSGEVERQAGAAYALGTMRDEAFEAVPYLIDLLDEEAELERVPGRHSKWWGHDNESRDQTTVAEEAAKALMYIGKPAEDLLETALQSRGTAWSGGDRAEWVLGFVRQFD